MASRYILPLDTYQFVQNIIPLNTLFLDEYQTDMPVWYDAAIWQSNSLNPVQASIAADSMNKFHIDHASLHMEIPNNSAATMSVTCYYWKCVKDTNYTDILNICESLSPIGVGGSYPNTLREFDIFSVPAVGVFFKIFKVSRKRIAPSKTARFNYTCRSGRGSPGTYLRPIEFDSSGTGSGFSYQVANLSRGMLVKVTTDLYAGPPNNLGTRGNSSRSPNAMFTENMGARVTYRYKYRVDNTIPQMDVQSTYDVVPGGAALRTYAPATLDPKSYTLVPP